MIKHRLVLFLLKQLIVFLVLLAAVTLLGWQHKYLWVGQGVSIGILLSQWLRERNADRTKRTDHG